MSVLKINWRPDVRTLRSFGWIGAAAFPILAAMSWWQYAMFALLPLGVAATTAYVLLALGAYCLSCAALAPVALRPLYVAMSAIGYPIGLVVGTVALGFVYYLVITPIGLVFRLIGRDPLCRAWDPRAASYWVPRRTSSDVRRYFRQF